MINVKQEDNGSFTISWDETDPKESILNTWTEEDFINAIIDAANESIAIEEYNTNLRKKSRKTNYTIDQTAEEVQQDIDTARKFTENNTSEAKKKDWDEFWS
ncbi:hypothetical protein S-PM2d004 [Synechococcus phage S-PM2]|uniref:Hypothetical-Protein / belonging to T4-LIKE GC: 751 n=1 Tax=Synechococcus phage S-PM2 TaxID=238854 RepID=Q5GQR6_BPSYP|nr:Hypothetical-Protein / belonging to T4-LIKE GC: 751 [Synechococcus phage S-PM2]CAF34068.1 Hypothetical-Protein / belonging to T4-LIKE GC: 751 [Synechococcus phage S-PM2]CFW42138.1 hypothetical protein S-PM2d004 [Synechococcus phage S-PM2]